MIRKYFFKIFLALTSVLVLYFGVFFVLSLNYKHQIHKFIVNSINDKIKKPVKIKDIDLSPFSGFPYISLTLHDVVVPKSDSSERPLLKLKKMEVLLGLHRLLFKDYNITGITLSDGILDGRVDSLGNKDFDIFIKKDTVAEKSHISEIKIDKVKLKNFEIYYEDQYKSKCIHLILKDTESRVHLDSNQVNANLRGSIHSEEVTLRPGTLFQNADLLAHFLINYDFNSELLSFDKSTLEAKNDLYIVNGNIDFLNKSLMSLNIKTENASVQNIFSLLPARWTKSIEELNVSGKVNAEASIAINLLPGHQPKFNIDFSGKGFSIANKLLNADVHDISFPTANLTSADSQGAEKYKITFTGLKGVINKSDSIMASQLAFENFVDPDLHAKVSIKLRSKTLFDLVHFDQYSEAGGSFFIRGTYNGKVNYLLGRTTKTPVIKGTVKLHRVNVKLNKVYFPFDNLNGEAEFENDFIKMKRLEVQCGKTDMKVNGIARNLFNSVYNDKPGLELDLNFVSEQFYFSDFTQFPRSKVKNEKRNIRLVEGSKFIWPYNLRATLKGKTSRFQAHNYQANDIDLSIHMDSKNLRVSESLTSFGGTMRSVTDFIPRKNHIHCNTDVRIEKIRIDKIFRAFNNFGQEIILSDNIRGIVNGKFDTYFRMNSALELDSNSVYVKGDYEIHRLEMIDVEPIMKLSKVGFKEMDLQRVTFDKIKSSVIIKNNVIDIPRTLFVTNILYFYLNATIQPDGEAEFKMLVPVKNLKKNPDTSDLTNDSKAGLSLPLKLKGKSGKLKVL
ncbi:MAG: hypothetical protein J7604_14255 [Sporocytophaga sp.]|uniref:hypothetical protein n=1 Tax=Sporocytophaga sp. TaxID=2231183 RepID=UPI001B1D6737|nr:hypothetical protein [Sporocytophaga sp.]MBO9701368.1 hypothetical protein [Sporocytophaga sp.]